MRLGDICSAPCFAKAACFEIPRPGCSKEDLKFADDGRQYFAVNLSNHGRRDRIISPRLGIVGLSPAATQINEFVEAYSETQSYIEASIRGAFAGLTAEIIAMLRGVGLAKKLRLSLPNSESLARHPDIYVTSLIGCATLDANGKSDDFDPMEFEGTRRCVTHRFVDEMLDPRFEHMNVVVVLGSKGHAAVSTLVDEKGRSVLERLEGAGKNVLFFPHPSPQNREYVHLASLPLSMVPRRDRYIAECWDRYRQKPPRPGRQKQPEAKLRTAVEN